MRLSVVLDGDVLCEDVGVVKWGAVVITPGDQIARFKPSPGSRVADLDVVWNAAPARRSLVIRDVRALLAILSSVATRDVGSDCVTGALLSAIDRASSFPAEGRERRPWLQFVVEALHRDFHNSLRMESLAREVGVHPVHVSRAFAQHHGMTMTNYLRHLRLARACELLLRTRLPISRIAAASGFADHAHFTRVFTAVVGRLPSSVRRQVGDSALAA